MLNNSPLNTVPLCVYVPVINGSLIDAGEYVDDVDLSCSCPVAGNIVVDETDEVLVSATVPVAFSAIVDEPVDSVFITCGGDDGAVVLVDEAGDEVEIFSWCPAACVIAAVEYKDTVESRLSWGRVDAVVSVDEYVDGVYLASATSSVCVISAIEPSDLVGIIANTEADESVIAICDVYEPVDSISSSCFACIGAIINVAEYVDGASLSSVVSPYCSVNIAEDADIVSIRFTPPSSVLDFSRDVVSPVVLSDAPVVTPLHFQR